MQEMVLKFVASARAAGLRVSTAEVMDCLRHLPRLDVLDEPQFRTALRATFAKSRLEQARFDRLYHLYFHELREDLDVSSKPLQEQMEALRADLQEADGGPELDAVAEFLAGEPEAFLALINRLSTQRPVDTLAGMGWANALAGLGPRLAATMALDRVPTLLGAFLTANRRQIPWELRRDLEREVRRRLRAARRLLDPLQEPRTEPRSDAAPAVYGELGERSFANLTPTEMLRLRDAIASLVRKLRDNASRRQAARSRGVPDLKRTLRAATRTQGIPLVLKYRHRPPRKARILTLCDVSASVWSSARFTLSTLYALQDCFQRVRTFVFVDKPVEVTALFDDHDVDRALQEVLTHPDVHYNASTDYGRMLRLFSERHLHAVNKKTTIIVIGDGRSNYRNPAGSILEELKERARRVLWLNPELRALWYTGDSEMHTYETYCHDVRQCQNLNQLAAFFHELVL